GGRERVAGRHDREDRRAATDLAREVEQRRATTLDRNAEARQDVVGRATTRGTGPQCRYGLVELGDAPGATARQDRDPESGREQQDQPDLSAIRHVAATRRRRIRTGDTPARRPARPRRRGDTAGSRDSRSRPVRHHRDGPPARIRPGFWTDETTRA